MNTNLGLFTGSVFKQGIDIYIHHHLAQLMAKMDDDDYNETPSKSFYW